MYQGLVLFVLGCLKIHLELVRVARVTAVFAAWQDKGSLSREVNRPIGAANGG